MARGDYKGSWARNSPDWLVEDVTSGGVNNPGAVGLFACTDLFNESEVGEYLWVYKISLVNSGTFSIRVTQVFGNCGGVSGPGVPVVIGQPATAGTIFVNQLASHSIAQVEPYLTGANSSVVVEEISPPGPVAIIPPGYSLRLINNQTQFGFTCWFYWIVRGGRR